MIRADGTPMIIDFGAIKLIGQQTQLRSGARSFAVMKQFYSPPEQIEEGGELDHRADIYSIGAVLYRALSGGPPTSAEERMQKRAFGKPDPYVPLAANASHIAACAMN
jgi:serine/threonine protein kinase